MLAVIFVGQHCRSSLLARVSLEPTKLTFFNGATVRRSSSDPTMSILNIVGPTALTAVFVCELSGDSSSLDVVLSSHGSNMIDFSCELRRFVSISGPVNDSSKSRFFAKILRFFFIFVLNKM